MGGTGEINRHVDEWKGKLNIISQTGENKDEEKQWNRKRWTLLIEMFMYFGNEYILSWDETIAFYTLLGILITYEWKTEKWKSQHICLWKHVIFFTDI